MDEMVLFAEKMLSVGKEVQDSTSAGLSQKAFFWFVVAEEYFASHDGGFSSSFRQFLDRHSLLFRSFFACSSFGSRSVFDRLTNNERETNERRTRT